MASLRPLRVAAVLLFFLGCTPTPAPRAQVEPALEIPSVGSAAKSPAGPAQPSKVVTPAEPDPPNLYSWQDPQVVLRLAADCRWKPADLSLAMLSCLPTTGDFNADPCLDEYESVCKPRCTKVCTDCASVCVNSCESCKKDCTDDACKTACGAQCATCRNTCSVTANNCVSSGCGQGFSSCRLALADEMKKPVCKTSCQRATRCATSCSATNDACFAACAKGFASSCSERLFKQCTAGARGP